MRAGAPVPADQLARTRLENAALSYAASVLGFGERGKAGGELDRAAEEYAEAVLAVKLARRTTKKVSR